MKTLGKIIVGILVCLVLVLLVLRITGLDPKGRRPGLWLTGNVATTPVADWSFTDKIPTVEIQTRTWYLIPHSVTTNCLSANGQLYLSSGIPAGMQYPNDRDWHANVARDPHVRMKVGDQLYDRTLSVVTDPVEKAAVLQAREKKYPQLKVPANGTLVVFHVLDN